MENSTLTPIKKFDPFIFGQPMFMIDTPRRFKLEMCTEYKIPQCTVKLMINPVVQDMLKKLQEAKPTIQFQHLYPGFPVYDGDEIVKVYSE